MGKGILLKWRALGRWLISGTNLLDINGIGWNLQWWKFMVND
jgi:hypothetical protein